MWHFCGRSRARKCQALSGRGMPIQCHVSHQKNWRQSNKSAVFGYCRSRATFFVWHCRFLARMWQFPGLRDLVKQGDSVVRNLCGMINTHGTGVPMVFLVLFNALNRTHPLSFAVCLPSLIRVCSPSFAFTHSRLLVCVCPPLFMFAAVAAGHTVMVIVVRGTCGGD